MCFAKYRPRILHVTGPAEQRVGSADKEISDAKMSSSDSPYHICLGFSSSIMIKKYMIVENFEYHLHPFGILLLDGSYYMDGCLHCLAVTYPFCNLNDGLANCCY